MSFSEDTLLNTVAHKASYKIYIKFLFKKILRYVLVENGYVLSSKWGQKMLF